MHNAVILWLEFARVAKMSSSKSASELPSGYIPENIPSASYSSAMIPKANNNNELQVRTFDDFGYKRRVFGLVMDPATNQILLTTSVRNASRYIVPGGGIDPGEEPEQAVVREVFEECGVHCTILKYCKQVLNHKRKNRSWVFVCTKTSESDSWDEEHLRSRRWFSLDDARVQLAKNTEKAYLADLLNLI